MLGTLFQNIINTSLKGRYCAMNNIVEYCKDTLVQPGKLRSNSLQTSSVSHFIVYSSLLLISHG